jgi:hypothetical protein
MMSLLLHYVSVIKNTTRCSLVYPSAVCVLALRLAARSMAWVGGSSRAGIAGSDPAGTMDVSLLLVLCVVRQRSLRRAWSLVQRSSTECGVSEYDREASIMRPWPSKSSFMLSVTQIMRWWIEALKWRYEGSASCQIHGTVGTITSKDRGITRKFSLNQT